MGNIQKLETNTLTNNPKIWDDSYIKVVKAELNLARCPDETFKRFLYQCQRAGFDPLAGHCSLVERNSKDKRGNYVSNWVFQTHKDGLLARANTFPDWNGKESGYIMPSDKFECDLGTGTVTHKFGLEHFSRDTMPIGAWARVSRKNHAPTLRVITFDEFKQVYWKNGQECLSPSWAKMPGNMIEKCAVAAALREAFPDVFSGIYDEAELDGNVLQQPEPKTPLKPEIPNNRKTNSKPLPPVADDPGEQTLTAGDVQSVITQTAHKAKGEIMELCEAATREGIFNDPLHALREVFENDDVTFDHINRAEKPKQIGKILNAIDQLKAMLG